MIIPVVDKEFLSYADVRKQIANVIQSVAPLATVHDEWRTEFNEDGLRKIASLLYGQGADSERIHAWQVAISASQVVRGSTNDCEMVGSDAQYSLTLNVDAWGFFSYSGLVDAWEVAENETRLVQATINRNRTRLFDGHPKQKFFQTATPFDLQSIDIEPFADGVNVIVSQNVFQVIVSEDLN